MEQFKVHLAIYLAFWSIIIGAATAAYLDLINWVIDFFRKVLPPFFEIPSTWRPFAICLPLGLVIGLTQKYIGQYPLTIAQVLSEMRVTGHFSFKRWWKILFSGLLILGAGASVGPEASASGLVAGMIYWLGCRYKQVRARENQLAHQPFHRQFHALWLDRLTNDTYQHSIDEFFKSPQRKKCFYLIYTLIAFIGLVGFFKFFP